MVQKITGITHAYMIQVSTYRNKHLIPQSNTQDWKSMSVYEKLTRHVTGLGNHQISITPSKRSSSLKPMLSNPCPNTYMWEDKGARALDPSWLARKLRINPTLGHMLQNRVCSKRRFISIVPPLRVMGTTISTVWATEPLTLKASYTWTQVILSITQRTMGKLVTCRKKD